MRRLVVVFICGALGACSAPFPPDAPATSILRLGDYRTVADCGYVELSRKYPSLSQAASDAAKRIDVRYDVDGTAAWLVSFADAGGGLTKIEVHARRPVRGDKANVEQIANQVAYCGRRIETDGVAPR